MTGLADMTVSVWSAGRADESPLDRQRFTVEDFARERCPRCNSGAVFCASGFLDVPEVDGIELVVCRCEDCDLTVAGVLGGDVGCAQCYTDDPRECRCGGAR